MKPTQTCAPPQQLWIDREDALSTIEKLESTQNCTAEEASWLRDFYRDGYIVWRKVISEEAVAALRDELQQLYQQPDRYIMRLQKQILAFPTESILPWRSRLLDFYVPSLLARQMVLVPQITRFLQLIYQEPAMVFQSLLFTWGSEQSMHKDTAFVVIDPPCTLTASWIALEKIEKGQGELMYFPGSHRDPMFLFGEERLFWQAAKDGKGMHQRYTEFLGQQAKAKGVAIQRFAAEPGDILLWHPNLTHGGCRVTEPEKTRLSLVSHYCPASAKPRYFSAFGRDTRQAFDDGYFSSRYYDLAEEGFPLAVKPQ
ncbi:MAG: phytanoyl-CoA dioxygenase family protein [Cellvibrionales bacterium]|jgi:phytanoyl-CoA hydroxylase|nr:phytanoyl-CoA dioxygenase family protein [Cellvibrionales bacterium]